MTVEYLDAKRIQGVSAISGSAGWTQTGTSVTIQNDVGGGTAVDLTTDDRISKSFSALTDTKWVCDFDVKISSIASARGFIPLSINDGTGDLLAGDVIAVEAWDQSGSTKLRIKSIVGSSSDQTGGMSTALTDGTQYYCRLIRSTATATELSIYTSSARTGTPHGTSTISSLSSSVGGLDTVGSGSDQFGNSGETASYEINNIKIYDDKTTPSGTPEFQSNFAGTPSDKSTLLTDGKSCFLDGTDDYVTAPATILSGIGTGIFSMAMWIRSDTSSRALIGYSSGNYWEIHRNGSGKMEYSSNTNRSGSTVLSDDTWYHLVVQRNGSDIISMWVDGVAQTMSDSTADTVSFSGDVTIGKRGTFWSGYIDDMVITSDLLTASEISDLAGGKTVAQVNPDNQTVHYTFQSDFTDSSGNARNGTATGAVAGSTTSPPAYTYSNLQENTIFNETDTYKQYWLQDGVWEYGKVPAINASGLKTYWKFNEASGDIINQSLSSDSLGSDANLQVTGAAYQTGSPPIGNSMTFDGINDYAVAGSSVSQFNFIHMPDAKWTIAFWGKWLDLTSDKFWGDCDTGQGFRMRAETNGSWEIVLLNNSGGNLTQGNNSSNGYVTENTWQFFCFRWDNTLSSNNWEWRRNNGNSEYLDKDASDFPTSGNAQNPMTFAKNSNASSHYDNVAVSEFSVWSKVLSAADETSLYNDGDGLEIY